MCSAEHDGNQYNLLAHLPNHPPYVGLEVLPFIVSLLIRSLFVKSALINAIVLLCRKFSIISYAVSKTYCSVRESQNDVLFK
jgi:hypothetical protein